MNPYPLLRVLYGLFLGLAFVIGGTMTLTSRGEPGIGLRIGYTYLSERARERANRVTGIGSILLGLLLMLSPFFLPLYAMFVLLMVGVISLLGTGYTVAKREYELEELSMEAPAKPGRKIERPRARKYLILQSTFAGFSIALLIAGKLPQETGFLIIILLQLFLHRKSYRQYEFFRLKKYPPLR